MANNGSETKVERNSTQSDLEQTELFIRMNPMLSKAHMRFYKTKDTICVYRTFWRLNDLKELISICELTSFNFLIETAERILIYKK